MYRLFESFARKVEEQANEQATLNRGTDGRLCNEMEIGHAAPSQPAVALPLVSYQEPISSPLPLPSQRRQFRAFIFIPAPVCHVPRPSARLQESDQQRENTGMSLSECRSVADR